MMDRSISGHRIHAIDVIRGLVMVIMALDHTRDLIHVDGLKGDPTDLSYTTPFLFFTRWITHLCAPTFVFLAGVSAYLSVTSSNSFSQSRQFLLSRGLWLVLLELTVVNFGVWFDLKFQVLLFQVIGAIGVSFIVLGLVLKLKSSTIGLIGLLIIVFHQLSQAIPLAPESGLRVLIDLLFTSQFYQLSPNHALIWAYPPLP